MGTLDVMIPHYGDLGLLRTAVASVLVQSDGNWALTVVDDGRTEGLAEWLTELADDRIRLVRNKSNLGINRNFQKCLDLATRDRVVVMGCDDVMLPNYVAVVRAAEAGCPKAGMIQPGVEVIDETGAVTWPLADVVKQRLCRPRLAGRAVLGGESLAVSLLRGNWLYFPSMCWRTDVVRAVGFRPGLSVVLDLALVLDLLDRGEQLVLDDVIAFRYRRHVASLSSERAFDGRRFAEERAFFLEREASARKAGWDRAARAARLHLSSRLHALTLVPGALRGGNRTGARVLAAHAFGSLRPPSA